MRRLLFVWLASVVGAATVGAMLAAGQTTTPDTTTISGADIGFRVESSDRSGRPMGRLVIRWNGEWVEPVSLPSLRLLQH